jgi:antitoxin CcdA
MLYDVRANRKATNLSINEDLLRRARALELNLSRVLEERLIEILRQEQRAEWVAENRDAIGDYNRRITERGSFSDGLRRF